RWRLGSFCDAAGRLSAKKPHPDSRVQRRWGTVLAQWLATALLPDAEGRGSGQQQIWHLRAGDRQGGRNGVDGFWKRIFVGVVEPRGQPDRVSLERRNSNR